MIHNPRIRADITADKNQGVHDEVGGRGLIFSNLFLIPQFDVRAKESEQKSGRMVESQRTHNTAMHLNRPRGRSLSGQLSDSPRDTNHISNLGPTNFGKS